MYFSNISDEEMDKYHQQIYAPNFTIKLTDMADSGLFKIETINDNLLKIYPLFYTKTITSSNPNDQILENKCIICENNNKTRVTFISDENAEIEDYIAYGTYKEIGDTLTDAEWNSMVQLIRNNHILTSNIKIKNGAVVDDYAEYDFDINSSTIVDNGILITEETLESLGTVTLINPCFHYATYTLTLTVLSVDEINILDPSDSETETTTITLELIENEPVNIPFETLNKYCIILFNATISITQNKPIINGAYITALDITADKPIIQTNETSILEITATDLEHLPMPNKTIQLLKNNTLLDTLTTDSQGKCSYTYTGIGAGKQDFIAKYRSLQSEIYEIIDGIFSDDGVTSPKPVNWYKATNTLEVSIDNTGTLLSCTEATNYYANSTSSINRFIESDFAVEFDVVEFTGQFGVRIRTTSNTDINLGNVASAGSHILIQFKDNVLTYTIDDGTPQVVSQSITGNIGVSIRLGTGTNSIRYKNFVIYPV